MAEGASPPAGPPGRPEELRPLLLGRGRFLDDLSVPGMLHAAFVRSPHAAARIEAIETSAVLAARGVVAVFTGSDLQEKIRPIRTQLATDTRATYRCSDWPVLAADEVRYVGEAVAVVVAESRYLAEDAAALIEVAFSPQPAVSEAEAALRPGAPRVHAGLPDNRLFEAMVGSGFATADPAISVSACFRHPRVTGAAIENYGALAEYRPNEAELLLWSGTQIPHLLRDLICACLDLKETAVRVIAPDVGGAFGIKMQAFPEELVLAHLALRLRRPVKWTEDRIENLVASFHARDCVVEAELTAGPDGILRGLTARACVNAGAYSSFPLSAALEPLTIASALPGPYRLPAYAYEGAAVATHRCPLGAYRGVGFTLGPLVMEGLMDRLARKLGIDPLEIRRRNLIVSAEMPATSAAGALYDSGDYPRLLALAADTAGYHAWRQQQAQARSAGRLLGIGIACFVEPTGMNRAVYRRRGMVHVPGTDAARLSVDRSGEIEAAVSTPSQGQTQRHAFKRILAKRLGVAETAIRVILGDTGRTPYGSGTFASRSMVGGGGALLAAAGALEERLIALAAQRWNLPASALRYANGAVEKAQSPLGEKMGERLDLAALALYAHGPDAPMFRGAEPRGSEPGIVVDMNYDSPITPVSAAVHLALVEVEKNTGRVRVLRYVVAEDCGPIVDRAGVDGQIRGGIAQGIGSALFEEIIYDSEGQVLTASLADYLLPGSCDIPPIEIVHMETASPGTAGGLKGVGESGTIGAPAAIAGAVIDALGVDPAEVRLPLTPERVRALCRPVP